MKKNKILAAALSGVLLICAAGCGNAPEGDGSASAAAPSVEQQEEQPGEEQTTEPAVQEPQKNEETSKPQENTVPSAGDKNTSASAPLDKPAESKPAPAPDPEPEQKAPTASDASAFIGKSASSMIAAIGAPVSKSYASSCMGDGEDGELKYNGFTVYTYKEGDSEKVIDVA